MHTDMLGAPVNPGDFVAYSVTQYRRAALRIGIVKELVTKPGRYGRGDIAAVKVRIIANSRGVNMSDTNSPLYSANRTAYLDSLVVVHTVPERVKNFLLSGKSSEATTSGRLDIESIVGDDDVED